MNLPNPEFDDLLEAHFAGDATDAQRTRLAELLRAEPELRRSFVHTAQHEARLYAFSSTSPDASLLAEPRIAPHSAHDDVANANSLRRTARRLGAGWRRFDLAAIAVVAVVAITAYYTLRIGRAPGPDIAADPVPAGPVEPIGPPPSDDRAVSPAVESQQLSGLIQSVDVDAKTFVLSGRNETRTTFRVAVAAEENREAAKIHLDGARSTFDEALRTRRRATVTFVRMPDGKAWVWAVDVSSEAR